MLRALGTPTASGKVITEESVLGLSAAWGCQRILTESIGSLPLGVYRKDKAGNAQKTDEHPLADILASPNTEQSIVEFLEQIVLSLVANGNGYSFKETTGAGEVTSLTPIAAALVRPMRKLGSNTRLAINDGAAFYRIDDRGKHEDYPRDKIWHVKLFSRDGLCGLSPVGYQRETAGFDMATAEFGARFFSQGASPAGTVTYPGFLTEDQREEARQAIQMMVAGLGNAHQVALFEGGMKPEPWGAMPLRDMEYVLLRKFGVQEMCRFYRVPPHMVADLERATFSNIEHQGLEFVTYTLMPYFRRIEESALKWLFRVQDRKQYFLRFNADALLRGDTAARGEYYSKLLQNGVVSRNEVRAKENWNRVEGLDGYTVQSAMVPVDRLDELVDAQIEGNAQPAVAPATTTEPAMPKSADADAPRFDIHLPEILGKDMSYVVKHPAVNAILAKVERAEAKLQARAEAFEKSTRATVDAVERAATESIERGAALEQATKAAIDTIHAELARGLAEVARTERLPRKAVFDERGEIIGSEVVEHLRLVKAA